MLQFIGAGMENLNHSEKTSLMAKNKLLKNKEFLQEVISLAVSHTQRRKSEPGSFLKKIIDNLRINGFRKGKVPKNLLIQNMSHICGADDEIFSAVLNCWMEVRFELESQLKEFIELHDFSDIRNDFGDEFVWDETTIEKASDLFIQAHPNSDKREVMLMVSLLAEKGEMIEKDEKSLPEPYQEILAKFREIDPFSEIWDFASEFSSSFLKLYNSKLSDRNNAEKAYQFSQRHLSDCLEELRRDQTGCINYLEKKQYVSRWSALNCPDGKIEDAINSVQELQSLLNNFMQPLPANFSSVKEEDEAHSGRRIMRVRIDTIFEELNKGLITLSKADETKETPVYEPSNKLGPLKKDVASQDIINKLSDIDSDGDKSASETKSKVSICDTEDAKLAELSATKEEQKIQEPVSILSKSQKTSPLTGMVGDIEINEIIMQSWNSLANNHHGSAY
jgi:hypothetical protein